MRGSTVLAIVVPEVALHQAMSTAGDPHDLAREAEHLLSVGRVAEAEGLCHALLGVAPDHPTALMILSVVCMAAERWADAEVLLLRGCASHPQIVGFHAALGRMRLRLNQYAQAVEPLENCVLLDPDTRDHRATLVGLYQTRLFASFSPESKRAMLACLADDTLTHSLMHRAWLSLLRVDPEAADYLALFDGATDYPSFRARLARTPRLLFAIQDGQLLRRGLERFWAADVSIERGLTFVRRWFHENRSELNGFLPLLGTLARTCFFTEYVFATVEDASGLGRDGLSTPEAVALLGCYEPLWKHERATELPGLSDDPGYRDLMRTLILEPLEEQALRSTIPTLGPITDEVSRAVQGQYEENPYPRWTTVGGDATRGSGAGGGARKRSILVAGCGTGRDAADAALNFPAARVDAIDLSRASLAYGVRQARRMGIGNLFFAQADILNIGKSSRLKRNYDLIVASGVLHHMRDPQAGLRALLGVLRPGGILRVALYSRIARAPIVEARAWIKAAGFPPTASGIRDFRAAVIARPHTDPVRAWLLRSYDFYAVSPCRDLVFHVQEQTFTLPQIAEMARTLGLSVCRVDIKSPVHMAAYRERFPADPAATNLAHWHQMELLNPAIFAGMYSLWLYRTADESIADPSWLEGGDGDEPIDG